MHIFLDTANFDELRSAAKLGVVSGVTTNPSLMAKENNADLKSVITEIASIIDGPISAEVISLDAAGMIKEARDIAKWSPNVVVKIPITPAGLEATSVLSKEHIKCNLTLCFSPNQALLVALAGAAYVSPFVGRLDDITHDGMQLVTDVVTIYKQYDFSTQVIAASIRHPLHCLSAAKAGAHIATVPYKVLMQMIKHPLTDIGIERFMADWNSISKT
ncbi:MAG: fructose-6-phosphate aldolase [Chloroflexi bacterium]|jgi:transaldolase|nr:fructose-6-phosphate aldolase [Chloroflexota bacterium]MBT7080695.1 fructose-6-phosphate aldolase [Chloroflexota bacterium]MBT7290180.1 fructose-6-phosphate aldolase [Chloroflexota bacterium]